MAYQLNKNAITTNNINYFCLACDCSLDTKQEADTHVQSTEHCEKISFAPYFDKYKAHYIRKFTKGYYCSFCNILLPTALKVDTHINQEVHKHNRGNNLLKCTGQKIIAYDTVSIKESAWHGLNENVCSICDIEIEEETNHKKDATHVLNLIQKSVKFGANDAIYRQIDESTIHCLTCDKILSMKILDSHFDDIEHYDLYEACKIIKANDSSTIIKNDSNNKTKLDELKPTVTRYENNDKGNVAGIVNSLDTYRRNNIDINIEIGTAFCRKCWVVVKYNCHDIDIHIKNHSVDEKSEPLRYPTDAHNDSTEVNMNSLNTNLKDIINANETVTEKVQSQNHRETNDNGSDGTLPLDTDEQITIDDFKDDENISLPSTSKTSAKTSGLNDSKLDTDEIIKIAKDNYITFNAQNANAFCRICQVRLPSSLKSMMEHIKGFQHNKNRTKTEEAGKKEKSDYLKKIVTKRFIRTLDTMENAFSCHVIINKDYLLSDFSFFLMAESDNTNFLKCLVCNKNLLYTPLLYKHIINNHFKLHESEFLAIPVIKSIPLEFIREIRQGEFHCGFCNVLVIGWDSLEAHLNSSNHKEEKIAKYIHLRLLSNLL